MAQAVIPERVTKVTRAVLLSSVKGVPLKRFCKDYKALVGEEFPWRGLGYQSAVQLLQTMPSVVRFQFSQKDNDYQLFGVGDKHSFMPSWVRKAEGTVSCITPRCSASPVREPCTGLTYSARGLVSIYISWYRKGKHVTLNQATVLRMKDQLTAMMKDVGKPVEVYIHENSYGFVRFRTLEEGQKAIDTFNGANMNGLHFKVKPANEKMPQGSPKANVAKSMNFKEKQRNKQVGSYKNDKQRKRTSPQLFAHSPSQQNPHWAQTKGTFPLAHAAGSLVHSQENKSHHPVITSYDTPFLPTTVGYERGCRDSDSKSESESSLEWDEDLLSNPVAFQLPAIHMSDPGEPGQVFPSMENSIWKAILSACIGKQSSWYERFRGVCSEASLQVTECCSATHFWARIDEQSKQCTEIETCLRFLTPSKAIPEAGSVCAAFSEDSNSWKRCWYRESVNESAMVLYIDEGKWDEVPVGCLATLPPFVTSLPMQAVPCILSGLELTSWSPEYLMQGAGCLRQLTEGMGLKAKLMLNPMSSIHEPIPVIMVDTGRDTNINAAMLTTGLARLIQPPSHPPSDTSSVVSEEGSARRETIPFLESSHSPTFPNEASCSRCPLSQCHLSSFSVPNESGLTPVRVSEVVSPDLLWLQLAKDPEGDISRISARIASLSPQSISSLRRKVQCGSLCCIKLPDSQYRRVKVENIRGQPDQQANVLWIDVGTTSLVKLQQLYQMPHEFSISIVPPLAIPCKLHGVVSTYLVDGHQGWFSLDNQMLWKHLYQKKVFAKFVENPCTGQSTSPGTVELYFDHDEQDNVMEVLVKDGYHLDFSQNESKIKPAPTNIVGCAHLFNTNTSFTSEVDPAAEWLNDGLRSSSFGNGARDGYVFNEPKKDSKATDSTSEHQAQQRQWESVSPWKRMQLTYKAITD